jgi:hypothetical protein
MRHRQTKGPDTDRPDLNNRVTSRLYTFGVVTLNGAGFLLYWRANGSG